MIRFILFSFNFIYKENIFSLICLIIYGIMNVYQCSEKNIYGIEYHTQSYLWKYDKYYF